MAKLIKVGDRIFDLEQISTAQYFPCVGGKAAMLRIFFNSTAIDLKDVEAEKVWEMLKSSAKYPN